MEIKKAQNYISERNNAKISFCTSENNNYKISDILSDVEKVIKNLLFCYYFLIEFLDFDSRITTRNNYRFN